ncbi:MAG: nitroreductase [Marinilabiliales bacterium]|nr:MAG: nitroreductase [Marinilabiliales bacterium]
MKTFNFLSLVKERQSDRKYSDKPVEKEKLMRCLEAGRLAPSACNAQPWTFIVVDDPELKNKVAKETSGGVLPLNHFTSQAPVLIAIVLEKPNITCRFGEVVKDKKFTIMDLGIAASHICLQAAAEGLGSCMLGWFNEKKVSDLLGIPGNKRPMLIITLGYPAGKKRKKIRKKPEDVIRFNSYKKQDH